MNADSNSLNLDTSVLPKYLQSSVRELQRFELLKFKLCWYIRSSVGCKNLFSFNNSRFTKAGSRVRLTEALAMDFISRNTTIRVPKVLDVFSINGTVHIIQECIHGSVLEDVWHTLSLDQQRSSMTQLKDCLDQLRALTPPDLDRVQAIDGSGCMDSRLGTGDSEWGPFDNHDAFHQFLNHDTLRKFPEKYPLLQNALATVDGRRYKTVFSHGDLGPHNLLWKDGQIVVIDWERSGWLPEYWDYTRVYAARGYDMPGWWEMFKETVTERYDDEVELDIQLKNYFEIY